MADIEELIRGYRPVGPPSDLRHVVVNGRRSGRRAWVLVAASALLALTCEVMASREQAAITNALIEGSRAAHDQQVRALADRLGKDETAILQAELIVALDEQEATIP